MFRGLENSVEELQPDPFVSLSRSDMKLCINVLASCRPNYLYICLDGIFRNTVFASDSPHRPVVYVYAGIITSGESFAAEIQEVASYFPVKEVVVDQEHKGIGRSFWDSFTRAFDNDYDFCLYMEDDWLITPTALQWLYDIPKIAAHYSLYRWQDRLDSDPESAEYCHDGDGYTVFRDGRYLSWSAAFSKDSFNFIHGLIKASALFGLYDRVLSDWEMRRWMYADWDQVIIPILKHYKLLSMMPPRSLLAHFGSKASHLFGFGLNTHRHEQMFAGDKSRWLDNVVELFDTTTVEEKAALSWRPHNFQYE
jgi:hypothetical protein